MTISTEMYATALFELGGADPLSFLNELEAFDVILEADELVRKYFLKTYGQFSLTVDILSEKFSREFINFLGIIYENRVFLDLDNIKNNYQRLLVENGFMTLVKVVSVNKLSDSHKASIIEMVKNKYSAPMKISYEIDKSLMAGYMIKINNDIYDTSLKSKLDQIKNLEV